MISPSQTLLPLFGVGIFLLSTIPGNAADFTWDGSDSTDWATAANWSPATVPVSTANAAVFNSSPTANQPNLSASSASNIRFETAGWGITGSGTFNLGVTSSITNNATSGTNSINVGLIRNNAGTDTVTVSAAAGGTLLLGNIQRRTSNWSYSGAGTIIQIGTDTTNTASTNYSSLSGSLLVGAGAQLKAGNATTTIGSNAAGSTIGGIGTIIGDDLSITTIEGTLSPGGNGGYLPSLFGDISLASTTTARTDFTLASGSTLRMDIGSGGIGNNDRLLMDLNAGGDFLYTAGTLNLVGGVIQDGTYTLIMDTGDTEAFSGVFSSVLFNGLAADPAKFTMNYGADTISVTIVGVPEPSTGLLLAGGIGAAIMASRRRRNNA